MMLKTIVFGVLAIAVLNNAYTVRYNRPASGIETLCRLNGAKDKIEEAEKAVGENFNRCVMDQIDAPTLMNEIMEANVNSTHKQVFKKYCAKSPQLKSCIHTMFVGVSPCTGDMSSIKRAADQFIDFVCYKNGDRLALFYTEDSRRCLLSRGNDINACANNMKYVPSIKEYMSLTIAQRCTKIYELTTCIAQKLETCDTPMVANMFKSLVKYTLNGIPCQIKTN